MTAIATDLGVEKDPDAPAEDLPPLNQEEIKHWKQRLVEAENHHKPYWDKAQKFRDEYLGPMDAAGYAAMLNPSLSAPGRPVNNIAAFVHTVTPMLFSEQPWPVVEPRWPDWEGESYSQGSRLLEARVRDCLSPLYVRGELQDALFEGIMLAGFCLIGWNPKGSMNAAVQVPNTDNVSVNVRPGLMEANNNPYAMVDEPYIRHIPYSRMRIDPYASRFENAAWVAYETTPLITDVQGNDVANSPLGIYHDTMSITPAGDFRSPYDNTMTSQPSYRGTMDKGVRLWHIYHKGRSPGEFGLLVLAGNNFQEIRHVYQNLGTDGFPIRMLSFHPVGRVFPASPIQFWWDQHNAMNEFLAEMTERARQTKEIVIVGNTPDKLHERLADAEGGQVLYTATSDLDRAIKNVKLGGVPQETFAAEQMHERMMDKAQGLTDRARAPGSPEGPRQSATQVQSTDSRSEERSSTYVGQWDAFQKGVVTDIAGMILKLQWQDVPVSIERGIGQPDIRLFSNRIVPANKAGYKFDIDVMERIRTTPALRQKRAQEDLVLLTNPVVVAALQAEGKRAKITPVVEEILESQGNRDLHRFLEDVPTPQQLAQQQQQQAQQENQQMQQTGQIAPVSPQTDDHALHVRVHQTVQDNPVVTEHMAEHYGYMGTMQPGVGQQPAFGGGQPPQASNFPNEGIAQSSPGQPQEAQLNTGSV